MTDYHAEVYLDTPDGVLELFSGDASAVDPFLLDGASLRWTREGGGQPDPVEARFSIIAPGPLAVDVGRRASVLVYDAPPPFGDLVADLHGRVAEVQAGPVVYGNPGGGSDLSGQLYDIVCVDFTVDPAEVTANFPAYPEQAATTRVAAYLDAAAADVPNGLVNVLGLDDWVSVKAEDPGAGGVADRIGGVLDQVGVAVLPSAPDALDRRLARRAILAPRVDASTLPGDFHSVAAWALDDPGAEYSSTTAADFPLVFTDLGDGWGLEVDDASPLVVSADYVDFTARWRRDKFTHPNRATVTYTPTGGTDETSAVVEADDRGTTDPVANLPLSAPLLGTEYAAGRMALMYLPENDSADRWTAEAFRYYPPDWTRLLHAPWFPRHADIDPVSPEIVPGDPATRAACYSLPVVIDGLNPDQTPTGRSWYAGTLSAVTLTLTGDRPTVEFTLRRVLPLGSGSGALKVSDIPAGVKVSDLADGFTVYDYRLARGA